MIDSNNINITKFGHIVLTPSSLTLLRQKILAADQTPCKTVSILKHLEHVSETFLFQSDEEQEASVKWIDQRIEEFCD